MAEPFKAYYNTREVRAITDLPTSTLRYWEEQFEQLSPMKDGKGNRFYTESDIEFIRQVKFIRDELKITRIEAIRRELKNPKRRVDVREQAVSILENLRARLAAIRAELVILLIATLATGCQPTKTESLPLRVMSYNIRLGIANDGANSWEKRCVATRAMLDSIHPDIFGVQEAYDFQLAYILTSCPRYRCVGVGREDGISEGEHMSIFYDTTRIELLRWGNYWLSETPNIPSRGWDAMCKRTATWTHLRLRENGSTFYYVNTHLDHVGFEARRRGLIMLYDSISAMNPHGEPMLLTGDFNVLPDNEGLQVLDGLLSSARATAEIRDTIGSFNGFGRLGHSDAAPQLGEGINVDVLEALDYIYYCRMGRCECFHVDTTTYVHIPYISDHYPVWADFTLHP